MNTRITQRNHPRAFNKKVAKNYLSSLSLVLFSSLLFLFPKETFAQEPVIKVKKTNTDIPQIAQEDSIYTLTLPDVVVLDDDLRKYPPLTREEQNKNWKHIRDVKLVLPFAEEIAHTLIETYEYMETFSSDKEWNRHLERIEKSLKEEYEPLMRKLTLKQGKLLIKLINRETNSTSYELIKALYGSFKASYYNVFAVFCGGNLRSKYSPETDSEDAFTERIITLYENNRLD